MGPDRPGDVAIGTLIEPVPVTGFAANFSPMPQIAPPPFGSESDGADTENESRVGAPFPAAVSLFLDSCSMFLRVCVRESRRANWSLEFSVAAFKTPLGATVSCGLHFDHM
jgi:hypothetical protein